MAKTTAKPILPTNYLDLDAVVPEKEVIVKLGGKEHKLAPITLEDFVKNLKTMQSLAANAPGDTAAEMEAQMNANIDMLCQSFPTMTDKLLRKLTLPQLNSLLAFAQRQNGSDDVSEEAKKDAGNPPVAGQ